MKNRTRGGFTLAELLIVVAIIGALVAVAVPVFGTQLEKSRQAVDVANMRSAYSAAIAQYLSTGAAVEGYFDGGGVTSARPARGYGRSGTNVSAFTTKFWDGVKVKASGVPNKDGTANYLSVKVDGDGGVTLAWGSGATISSKIVAGGTYTEAQRIEADKSLLDALQTNISNMTAGELKQIFQKAGVNTDDKGELNKVLSGSNNGHRTQAILASNRTGAGFENNPASDVRGTQPIWNSVLSDAGVDVNAVNNATEYLLSSINSGNTAHIAVRFEKSFENYADDELLTGAVVFVSPANGSASKVEERGFSYEQRSSSGS